MNFKTLNGNGKYKDLNAKENVVNYILRADKSPDGCNGYFLIDPTNPAKSMNKVAENFGKSNGVQLRHFVMTFSPDEMSDVDVVNQIARKITNYVGEEFQTVYAVHTDKAHLHIHLVFNSVSYLDGHRYYGKKREFNAFKTKLKKIVKEYGINEAIYLQKEKQT